MSDWKGKFTTINDDFSRVRRMPRLGRVRLGMKKISAKSGKEYPADCDFFVCPEEVRQVYGDRPTELDVMFASEDLGAIFPQKLACYTASGLWCHGDGQKAERYDEQSKAWKERDCPCEHRKTPENHAGDCDEVGHLMVVLPKISMGGVYQITTHSFYGAVAINSSIDYVRFLIGRISWVPLKLRRVPQEIKHDGMRIQKALLQLILDADIAGVNALREQTKRILETARYQIEAPAETPPSADPPDEVVESDPRDTEPEFPGTPPGEPDATPEELVPADPPASVAPSEPKKEAPPMKASLADEENDWTIWHNDAITYVVPYTKTRDKLKIPDNKPVNRGMRREFKRVFNEFLDKGVV